MNPIDDSKLFGVKLGANTTLAVSLAACKAGAAANKIPLYKLVVGHGPDGELLLLAAALNVVNGGSHAEDKLATEHDDGPQKIFEDALKDPCCMFFGSEHRVVSIVVASLYLNIPKDGVKVMCKSFGSDHPAVLIKDPYPKIAGDALKVTCKSLVSDYPVVLIVDSFNPKISGDAIKVMLEQKIFETFKDRYSKFVGIEFPIISNGDPFKLRKQKISEAPDEKSDGIKFPFISKWEASEEKSDGITFLFISKWDPLELWKQMISEAPEEKSDGIKFPFISKGEPFKLLKILEIFKEIFETLRDRYRDFAGSEFPIISIGDPFNPKIFGDAIRVICKSFGSGYPVVSIEDSFYSKISGDALKDYKSFVSNYPIVSILETKSRS